MGCGTGPGASIRSVEWTDHRRVPAAHWRPRPALSAGAQRGRHVSQTPPPALLKRGLDQRQRGSLPCHLSATPHTTLDPTGAPRTGVVCCRWETEAMPRRAPFCRFSVRATAHDPVIDSLEGAGGQSSGRRAGHCSLLRPFRRRRTNQRSRYEWSQSVNEPSLMAVSRPRRSASAAAGRVPSARPLRRGPAH